MWRSISREAFAQKLARQAAQQAEQDKDQHSQQGYFLGPRGGGDQNQIEWQPQHKQAGQTKHHPHRQKKPQPELATIAPMHQQTKIKIQQG